MAQLLKEYHLSWLSVHPEYDELWLKSALKMGFDIHHIDCDRDNNNPNNLLLIECRDHMALHGSPEFARMAVSMSRDIQCKIRRKKLPKSIEVYNFTSRLKILGFNKTTFSNEIGIHKTTVSGWGNYLPFYAYRMLLLMEDVARLNETTAIPPSNKAISKGTKL